MPTQNSMHDPFARGTDGMNFDYIKNLERQKQIPIEEAPIVEAPPSQKIFKPDEDKPQPKKAICPHVIVKESTIPLMEKQQNQQQVQVEKKEQTKPSIRLNVQIERQNDFRKIIQESQVQNQPKEAFNHF